MVRRFTHLTVVTLALIALVFATRAPAQQATPLQTELLSEIRLLRQAIESLTGTNARVQIVFGRLQLQEQRTATAARQLNDLRSAASGIALRAAETADRVREMEEAIADTGRKPEQLEALRQELAMTRREQERIESERLRLLAEETEAASLLNQEQGRWSDLNRQLDELERLLAPSRR
jgi:hypothetical protein